MALPEQTRSEIDSVLTYLIEVSLANDQNFSILRSISGGRVEVSFKGAEYLSLALKDRPYTWIYDALRSERAYSVLLPDGAMLQFSYQFLSNRLIRHRLGFWPSPYLDRFQNDPEIYREESVFADVVARRIVPFPIRFDHDLDHAVVRDIAHPIAHLTLGQYENCRIPLSAPLPPSHFVAFVLRNFYNTAFHRHEDGLPKIDSPYEDCISENERGLVHISVPTSLR